MCFLCFFGLLEAEIPFRKYLRTRQIEITTRLAVCRLRKLSAFKPNPQIFLISSFLSRHINSEHSFPCIEGDSINNGIQILSSHPNFHLSLQRGFSEITSFITGRALHAICVKHLAYLNVFHSNTLINMYLKFGNLHSAHYLFDKMPERDKVSWNTMISGYVRAALYDDGINLFHRMWTQGIEPDGFMIVNLLTACNKSGSMVSQGIQIHGLVIKIGLLSNVYVSSSLLHFYGTCGVMTHACRVFEEMPERNTVSWTCLMVGYSSIGDSDEVVEIYSRMRYQGVSCNQSCFSTVISSCGLLGDEILGRQVLAHVVVSGFGSNLSIENSLISMFGNFGNVEDAYYVFSHMSEHDIISWNSIVSAYSHNQLCEKSLKCFNLLLHTNLRPNATTLSSLAMACSSVDYIKWGRSIHGLILKLGLDSIVCLCTTLLTMYGESGRFQESKLLFQEMPEKDLISWNSMMALYVQNGEYKDFLSFLGELRQMSGMVDCVTLTTVLAGFSCPEALLEGKAIHSFIIQLGFHEHLLVGNALVTMYEKCGMMREAERVFWTMPERNGVTWNALIGGYAENEETQEAVTAFTSMRENHFSSDYITMVNILGSFSDPEELLKYGMPFHAHIISTGFDLDIYVHSSLITMYAKCGDLDSSNFLFERFHNGSSILWNSIIAANAHHGHGEEALKHFMEMHRFGSQLDKFSFSGALAASANLGLLEEGQQIHNLIIKLGFESNLQVTNAAADMYGKCGDMEAVMQMLPAASKRSLLSWNILLSGFSRNGSFRKAEETFHQMQLVGSKPDYITFIFVLSACNHRGLADEGLAYFASMKSEFGIPPRIEHCVCMVDLLGRSGRLIDAEKFIQEMPVAPNSFIWRSLLSACRNHNDLELGKKAAKHLLEFDPSDDSAYVLLSNVCAIQGRWEDMECIRKKMDLSNIKKKQGCSWIRANNVSSF